MKAHTYYIIFGRPSIPLAAPLQQGKTNRDFTEARDTEWQWHQLGHVQVCTSLQTDNHASTPPLSFYRPDALPAANQQSQSTEGTKQTSQTLTSTLFEMFHCIAAIGL